MVQCACSLVKWLLLYVWYKCWNFVFFTHFCSHMHAHKSTHTDLCYSIWMYLFGSYTVQPFKKNVFSILTDSYMKLVVQKRLSKLHAWGSYFKETFELWKVHRPFCTMKLGVFRAQFSCCIRTFSLIVLTSNWSPLKLKQMQMHNNTFLWVVRDELSKAQKSGHSPCFFPIGLPGSKNLFWSWNFSTLIRIGNGVIHFYRLDATIERLQKNVRTRITSLIFSQRIFSVFQIIRSRLFICYFLGRVC